MTRVPTHEPAREEHRQHILDGTFVGGCAGCDDDRFLTRRRSFDPLKNLTRPTFYESFGRTAEEMAQQLGDTIENARELIRNERAERDRDIAWVRDRYDWIVEQAPAWADSIVADVDPDAGEVTYIYQNALVSVSLRQRFMDEPYRHSARVDPPCVLIEEFAGDPADPLVKDTAKALQRLLQLIDANGGAL